MRFLNSFILFSLLQVIESVFQQDHGELESQESKNVFIGEEQETAMSALKELRKISSILSDM